MASEELQSATHLRPAVQVQIFSASTAIVVLQGEHDLATRLELRAAFARACAKPRVVADLGHCTFIDSSVIGELIRAARAVEAREGRFALVIPPEQRLVARVAGLAGLAEFLAVHPSCDAALASFERG